jgi:hypothetical protein
MTLSRYGTILRDAAQWNRGTELLSAAVAFHQYRLAPKRHVGDEFVGLLNIARKSPPRLVKRFIAAEVERMRPALNSWSTAATESAALVTPLELSSTTILKVPAHNEKGVLFVATEGDLVVLLRHPKLSAITSSYLIVVASAWSPPDFAKYVETIGRFQDPLFVVISNWADLEYYRYLSPWVQPIPVLTSDFLNPDLFAPKDARERDIDIIMVAGWGRYKRHWLLFEALRKMPSSLRVVLVGANNQQRTVEDVKKLAVAFGVKQDLEFLSGIPVSEVHALQCRARISAQFSSREGACVAIAESLMANTPVAMMRDAHVGAKKHINDRTGVLCSQCSIGKQLSDFLDSSDSFSARAWAVANISSDKSHRVLNDHLKTYVTDSGSRWSTDIARFYWNYFGVHYFQEDNVDGLLRAVDELKQSLGVVLRDSA